MLVAQRCRPLGRVRRLVLCSISMSRPMDMSLSLTGWSIDPVLLEDIRIELLHSEMTGDELRIKLKFTGGRESTVAVDLDKAHARLAFERLEREMKQGNGGSAGVPAPAPQGE